jgi:hypothetical protein
MKMGIAVAWAPSPALLEDDELPPEPLPVDDDEALALMVLLLSVVVKVLEPEVTVLTTAEVETAVPLPELPEPPAAP